MRRFTRVVLLVIGSVVTVVGLAVAVLAGPSDTVSTGERELATETAALVTSSSMFTFMGPTVHVTASTADGRDVFVGIAHEVDVAGYLDGVAYDQIERLSPPRSFEIGRVDGSVSGTGVEPGSRDWWYVDAHGPGQQAVAYPLGPEPVNVVVMAADGEPPLAITLELGLQIDNLFTTALLVLAAGLAVLAVAFFALRRRNQTARPPAEPSYDQARQEERQL